MYLSGIDLVNYRNYKKQNVTFSKGINIIHGDNAQGKTNLLEAIYLFTAGKSFRAQSDGELIGFGSSFAKVSIDFVSGERENKAEIIISDKRKKLIRLNELSLKKTGELLGVFKAVLFCPEELSLISGAPDTRRKFTDMYISSQKPLYYGILKNYNKILKQKNALLKTNPDETLLSVYNGNLAREGAKIIKYRAEYIKRLSEEADKFQKEISNGAESLSLKYFSSAPLSDFEDEEKTEKELLLAINKKTQSEIIQGTSVVGPHRDDIIFYINGKQAKLFASQGQQRTAVIALKTAQTELIKNETGEFPILLLDDVLSELDHSRRSFLTEKLCGKQVFITCTDVNSVKTDEKRKIFLVKEGKIV